MSDLTKEEIRELASDVIAECSPYVDPNYSYGTPHEDVEKAIERFLTRRKST